MFVIIDNYDSFTYNLYQIVAALKNVEVFRNDCVTVEEIEQMEPKAIFLSPGPGRPEDAGICVDLIKRLASKVPIFGVCLGLQAIGAAFGAKVVPAGEIYHGKTSLIFHYRRGIYQGMHVPFRACRYHSLMLETDSLPDVLVKEAETEQGMIMGVRHRDYPCYGVQFHPESILTAHGDKLIKNFINNVSI